MYRYEKRPSKIKGFILSIFLMGISSALSIFLYRMYLNININQTPIVQESEGKAVRLSIDNEEYFRYTRKHNKMYSWHIKNKK